MSFNFVEQLTRWRKTIEFQTIYQFSPSYSHESEIWIRCDGKNSVMERYLQMIVTSIFTHNTFENSKSLIIFYSLNLKWHFCIMFISKTHAKTFWTISMDLWWKCHKISQWVQEVFDRMSSFLAGVQYTYVCIYLQ